MIQALSGAIFDNSEDGKAFMSASNCLGELGKDVLEGQAIVLG